MQRSPRVLLISSQPFFQWRGTPIRISFDARALANLGYEVDLLTLPVGLDISIPGVRVLRVPNIFRVREVSIGPSLVKAAFDVLLLFRALGMNLRRWYTVIHGFEDTGLIAWLIGRLCRRRVVFEKHSDPSSYRGGGLRNVIMSLYAAVERFTARHADAVICTGPGLVDQIRAVRADDRVYHIHDIPSSLAQADAARVETIRSELAEQPDDIVAMFVGSFAVYQGVDLLFAAIPDVLRANPRVRFAIIGGTPDEIAERRRELAGQDAADRVAFLGKVPPDELPSVLAAADILLSPRVAGVNTPLKILDYFKAGKAIVATDVQSNRLLLGDRSAVLVEPTPSAFGQGIARVAEDPELRARLGEEGRRLSVEQYGFDRFRERLAQCYRTVQT